MGHSVIYKYAWATIYFCGVVGVGAIIIGVVWAKWIKNR
jgi:hypothetical protein